MEPGRGFEDQNAGAPDPCEDLRAALIKLLDLITSGRHYQTQNPYTRPEVKQAYQALGRDWRTEA